MTMTKTGCSLIIAALTFFGSQLPISASWVYTQTSVDAKTGEGIGTISDTVWTFKAVKGKDSKKLYVSGSEGTFAGSAPCPVDFSTGIMDSGGDDGYTVVSFKKFSASQSGNMREFRGMMTEFVAPDCVSIGESGVGRDFYGCTNLTKAVFNKELKINKGDYIFDSCYSLVEFYPRTLKSNSNAQIKSLFSGCSSLSGKFEIPELTSVHESMFKNTKVQEIVAPKVTSIAKSAFEGCASLTNIVTDSPITSIGEKAFMNCISLDMSFVDKMLNVNLNAINASSFAGCTGIEGPLVWNLPLINTLPNSCFSGCANISQVIFKTSVQTIGSSAFYNIKQGAEIYMPKEVPVSFGLFSVCRNVSGDISSLKWPKIYLAGNSEEWISAMDVYHCVVPKASFNDTSWVGTGYNGYNINVSWSIAKGMMAADTDMCEKNGDKLIVKDNKVVAFMFLKKNYSTQYYGCWVLRMPKSGLRVSVR